MNCEELASELIRFRTESPTGNEEDCARFLQDYMQDLKLDCETKLQKFGANRANLVVRVGTREVPGLLLSGHMDVVPPGNVNMWSSDPYEPKVINGKLYGRGAADMKGGLACLVTAIEELLKDGRQRLVKSLTLVATSGEESGFIGLEEMIKGHELLPGDAVFVVLAEPTDLGLANAHRGVTRLRVVFRGKSAHASTPELGTNSIEQAARFVSQVAKLQTKLSKMRDDSLGSTTLTVTRINGGTAENVVPGETEVLIDSRRIPAHSNNFVKESIDSLLATLKTLDPLLDPRVEQTVNHSSLNTPLDHPLVRLAEEVSETGAKPCPFSTEGSMYSDALGMPAVVLGPGRAQEAHIINEYVDLSKLSGAVSIYKRLIKRICA